MSKRRTSEIAEKVFLVSAIGIAVLGSLAVSCAIIGEVFSVIGVQLAAVVFLVIVVCILPLAIISFLIHYIYD